MKVDLSPRLDIIFQNLSRRAGEGDRVETRGSSVTFLLKTFFNSRDILFLLFMLPLKTVFLKALKIALETHLLARGWMVVGWVCGCWGISESKLIKLPICSSANHPESQLSVQGQFNLLSCPSFPELFAIYMYTEPAFFQFAKTFQIPTNAIEIALLHLNWLWGMHAHNNLRGVPFSWLLISVQLLKLAHKLSRCDSYLRNLKL